MRSVRISLKTARRLMELINRDSVPAGSSFEAINGLRRAMEPKRSIKASRVRKTAKRATKKEETAAVRDLVMERADGFCEACEINFDPDLRPGELDHFWGRGKEKQTAENCWALCRGCHRAKTDNVPSRSYWLAQFGNHCAVKGYDRQCARANREIEAAFDIAAAASLSRGGPQNV
jgi:hypothetical protein